ncbi:MAG TPA: hypothetical protein IAC45_03525 [Candidatus Aphodousia faecavium]|nr:hypothetical protein [Candidatus Aphodousia faecavium]
MYTKAIKTFFLEINLSSCKNKMKKLILGITLSLSLFGCAMQKATINSYVEPTYNAGSIKTVAVFPLRNASMAPAEANSINTEIVKALSQKSPTTLILSPAESQRRINDAGVVTQWSRFIEDFSTAGLINKAYLSDIANALKADAVMQGFISQIYQKDGMQFGDGIGVTRVSIRYAIIDLRNAKIIWEAHSTGRSQTGSFGFHVAPEVSEALEPTIEKLTENIPSL